VEETQREHIIYSMKKAVLFSLTLLLAPNVVLAAWWNPFTWFAKKSAPPVVVEVATTTSEVKTSVVVPVTSSPKAAPQAVIPKVTPAPAKTEPIFIINSVETRSKLSSAHIDWKTSKPTDSKVYILLSDGTKRVFVSPGGISTIHYADLSGLEAGTQYEYEIVGVSGLEAVSYKGTFITEAAPKVKTFEVKAESINGPLKITLRSEDGSPVPNKTFTLRTNYNDGPDFATQKLTTNNAGEFTVSRSNPIQANIRLIITTEDGGADRTFNLKQIDKANIAVIYQ
jgi:hypothetical protein